MEADFFMTDRLSFFLGGKSIKMTRVNISIPELAVKTHCMTQKPNIL